MKRKWIVLAAAVCTAGSQTSAAMAGELEDVVQPSAADYAAATRLMDPIVARLREGDAGAAINGAFANHPLGDRVAPQLPGLVSQLGTLYEIYGPIADCQQAQRSAVGSMVIRLIYNCQHEKYVSRWEVQIVQARQGWQLSTIKFSDP